MTGVAEKKKRMIKIYLLWVLLVGSLCCSCTGNKRLEYALEFAGENRGELEKVLEHYNDSGLKQDAARFLIENIIRKSKFPQNPKRSVRFSGKRTKRSVQKRKARNTQKAETKVL